MKKTIMQHVLRTALATLAAAALITSPAGGLTAHANDEIANNDQDPEDGYPNFFDISPRVVKIRAGESCKFDDFFSRYDYAYFITGSTSRQTYCECDFKSGSATPPILHIGADETGKNVFFYFYIDDRHVDGMSISDGERYASVEVYVQPASSSPVTAAAPATVLTKSATVPLSGGTTGTLSLIREDTVAMLYDAKGTALASFSISDGSGAMPKLSYGGVAQINGANYFTITTTKKTGTSVKISDSDKADRKSVV